MDSLGACVQRCKTISTLLQRYTFFYQITASGHDQ
jgi:hypothetical protein